MPDNYKKILAKITANTTTTVYTCPAATTAIINLISIANISSTNLETIEISINGGGTDTFINKGATIAAASTMQLPGPYVLLAGDTLKIKSGNANTIDVVGSLLEIT